MTATEALELSLELSGLSEVPPDSGVLVPGELGKRVLFAIDVGVAELLLAKELGASGVIAHHPPGGLPRLHWHQVLWRHTELLASYGVPEGEAKQAAAELVREFFAGTTPPTTTMFRPRPGRWASPWWGSTPP
ncbi:Nif3-like dinuclear metal center hexameric protein [Candidatus Bipolaricaulota bacterium]|nr:Nif3-like dinuclear metal center hexameric protein [Candidatus Bipolaricaulota bacterium]